MEESLRRWAILNPIAFIVSLVVVCLLGFFVDRFFIKHKKTYFEDSKPEGISERKYQLIFSIPGDSYSAAIGRFERILFFVSWFISPELIAAWLVFKVASKWEVWNNIFRIPERFGQKDELSSLAMRIWWGAGTYHRFLLGALLNILASLVGVAVFLALRKLWI